jgi:hypothetical protein
LRADRGQKMRPCSSAKVVNELPKEVESRLVQG